MGTPQCTVAVFIAVSNYGVSRCFLEQRRHAWGFSVAACVDTKALHNIEADLIL